MPQYELLTIATADHCGAVQARQWETRDGEASSCIGPRELALGLRGTAHTVVIPCLLSMPIRVRCVIRVRFSVWALGSPWLS